MDDLTRLQKCVTNIRKECALLKKKAVDTMQEIVSDKEVILDTLQEKKPNIDRETLRELLEMRALELIDPSNEVEEELDAFSRMIASNEDINDKLCPLMSQVWYGDMYEKTGREALLDLCSELKSRTKECSVDKVIGVVLIKND